MAGAQPHQQQGKRNNGAVIAAIAVGIDTDRASTPSILKKPGGEVLSLTHRADSDLDAHNRALERAINDGWFRFENDRFTYSCLIYGQAALQ